MKTTPEKRRFALPIGIAVAAHAFLLLGFSHPKTIETKNVKASPSRVDPPLVVELEPPEKTADSSSDSSPSSSNVPAIPEPIPDPKTTSPFPMTPTLVPVPHDGPTTNMIPVHWTTNGPEHVDHRIVSVSALDRVPRAIVRVPPPYPAQLRALGISGEVMVEFVVDEAGRVGDIRVVRSSHSEFEIVALKALPKWRFEPGRVNGRPVRFHMAIPLNFTVGE